MPELDQQIRLPDGRFLGFDQYGRADGRPLFYIHGSPSSRLEFRIFGSDALVQSLNARLIAVDRPGIGLSSFQPNRRLLDFPIDLLALADYLKIEKFSVFAYSLGGPYGLACALAIPERLEKVGIISGAALFTEAELMKDINPGTRRYLNLPRESPFAARAFLWMIHAMVRFFPKAMAANAATMLPAPDRAVFSDHEVQQSFVHMLREAFRQGRRGVFHDSLLSVTGYGFRLQEINFPIRLWHGEADQNIPLAMARYVASMLPNCEAYFSPGEAHLSLFKKNAAQLLGALL